MNKILMWTCLSIGMSFFSCKRNDNSQITSREDYSQYLSVDSLSIHKINKNYNYWSNRNETQSGNYIYLGKLAAAASEMFAQTGVIKYLKEAENSLENALIITDSTQTSYLQSLAVNYISQHRFKECLPLLAKARKRGDKVLVTQQILFDAHLELGNKPVAKKYLDSIFNPKDFNYLIRKSKWEDHEGNLDDAINYMSLASKIVEKNNQKSLMLWSYSNLGDYYGHAGRIKESYEAYLKTLEIDPSNHYVLKGIAWICYAHEKNTKEANRILDHILEVKPTPDIYLFKRELAQFSNNLEGSEHYKKAFFDSIDNPDYGNMYNTYVAELWLENPNKEYYAKALNIARIEVSNRPTPMSYDLLAWCYYKTGNFAKALSVNKQYVSGKTFEPVALFHTAKILKASKVDLQEVSEIKQELQSASYELGPLMMNDVNSL